MVYFETTLGTAPASGFLPDLFVDITPVWERKQEALGKITTQPHLAPAYDIVGRYRAQEARFSAHMEGCTYAEAFCRLGAENGG